MIQDYSEDKFDSDYYNIPPKEWIHMLGTLEARDDRRSTACESQKPATKNKKDGQPDEADDNSESIPRFTCKKHKPNTRKGKQQITWYKYHSSEKYNTFDSVKTKKDLIGNLYKSDASVKQFSILIRRLIIK